MDVISQISDDLLIRILSLIPTKHALATSCLSKRWQHVWSLVPKLVYDDRNHSDENYTSFTQFVYRSLLLNKAPVLESLYLNLGAKCKAVDIRIWIDIAVAHHVHSLEIDISTFDKKPIRLPGSLYTCETLETLMIKHPILLDVPFSVGLPSLKKLHLEDVDYAEEESLARLLSGCPKLEDLFIKQCKLEVPLVVPSLQSLVMLNDGRNEKDSGFVIDAPSLVFLYIEDNVLYDFHRFESMPKLKDAHVDMTHKVDHKFLKAFTFVRRLSLCLSLSEVLSSPDMIFHRLVDLTLNTCAQAWWDLLTHMLQVSPKLELLTLQDEHHEPGSSSKEAPDSWKQPSCVPECLFNSLEVFEWNGYKGRRGDLEIATYLVANATRLKRSYFKPESNEVGAKYKMIQELARLATPSPWSQLYFDLDF